MIAEIGLGALVCALLISLLLSAALRFPSMDVSRLMTGIFICISLAFALLVLAFAASDFSIVTVFSNSHTDKPLLYKLTGTWGNHEGSMLLWVWVLAAMSYGFSCYHHAQMDSLLPRATLGLLGVVMSGFLAFILFTSNPFARIFPPPWQGQGLNPLLQDIGLAIHPPLLYVGYVGFAVVSAMAVAILLVRGEVNGRWAQAVRPWALLAWGFLSLGIGMGSWWAYRELGWGGWWFWDPVENVSLLPWLAGTALIHCLLVLCKRPVLQNWTLLLAIFTFTFSLLGTFLVRSGLLTSVHSFASDPTRGLFILAFVSLITFGSLWLYAKRYPNASAPDFKPVSREGAILVNNLLLTALCATVLLGIVYPLILQALDLPSVSVGAPYFHQVFVPIALALVAVAGIGPLLSWKKASWQVMRRSVAMAGALSILTLLALFVALPWTLGDWFSIIGMICGVWMLAGSVAYGWRLWRLPQSISLVQWSMLAAHAGMAILVTAATLSGTFRISTERVLSPSETIEFAGYRIVVGAMETVQIDNYGAHRVTLDVDDGRFTLTPESRFYPERSMETAEAAIDSTLGSDLYAAISPLPDPTATRASQQFALRLYYLPAMFWLWLGFAMVGLGGLTASVGYFKNKNLA